MSCGTTHCTSSLVPGRAGSPTTASLTLSARIWRLAFSPVSVCQGLLCLTSPILTKVACACTPRMYSTHALTDVTLIKTRDGKKYGISPADPNGFVQALKLEMGHEVTTSGVKDVSVAPKLAPRHLGWVAWLSLSFAAATLIISLVMFSRLPTTLVIHWDLLGMPNGSLPRFWGAFLIPFLSLVFALVPLTLPDSTGTGRKTWYVLVVSVLGILFLCQLFLLLWNTGSGTTLGKVFMPLLIILIAGSIAIQLIYILRIERQGKHPAAK